MDRDERIPRMHAGPESRLRMAFENSKVSDKTNN